MSEPGDLCSRREVAETNRDHHAQASSREKNVTTEHHERQQLNQQYPNRKEVRVHGEHSCRDVADPGPPRRTQELRDEEVRRQADEEGHERVRPRLLRVLDDERIHCERDCCERSGYRSEQSNAEQIDDRRRQDCEYPGQRSNGSLAVAHVQPQVQKAVVEGHVRIDMQDRVLEI